MKYGRKFTLRRWEGILHKRVLFDVPTLANCVGRFRSLWCSGSVPNPKYHKDCLQVCCRHTAIMRGCCWKYYFCIRGCHILQDSGAMADETIRHTWTNQFIGIIRWLIWFYIPSEMHSEIINQRGGYSRVPSWCKAPYNQSQISTDDIPSSSKSTVYWFGIHIPLLVTNFSISSTLASLATASIQVISLLWMISHWILLGV